MSGAAGGGGAVDRSRADGGSPVTDREPGDGAGGPTTATDGGTAATDESTSAGTTGVDHVLELEDVDGGYGEVQVLSDLTMHLRDGEIVCLIGPNGAGKSTVLRTAFGLLEPWTGSVRYHGEEIGGMAPEDIVRLGVGYVPQRENVFGSLSVDENLRMGGVARESGLEGRIAELYDQFPLLDEKRSAKARSLSGGQRQIVALARALVMDPDALLVDEPSAGLSPSAAEDVFGEIRRINDLGTSIVIVEQNARDGLDIADRGYVLDQGTVRFEDDADALLEDPQVAELYLGG